MEYYVGIDLGGTKIAAGVVDDQYRIIGRAQLPTRAFHPAQEIADDLAAAARQALDQAGLPLEGARWVGVCSPGTANPRTGVVGLAANLGFHDTPLAALLGQRLPGKIYLENDANAATYGEMLAGAARGLDSVVMITLGTGVEGGELGHMPMVYQGVPCTCGRRGCIEAYCAVTALIRITREAMQLNATSKMWELAQGSLDRVNGRTAFDAMRAGDPAGTQVVEQYIDYLAYAVSGLINGFQPQAVVIGGGISKEGETLFGPVRQRALPMTFNYDPQNCTRILPAQLGNDAGIIGAALLGRQYQ